MYSTKANWQIHFDPEHVFYFFFFFHFGTFESIIYFSWLQELYFQCYFIQTPLIFVSVSADFMPDFRDNWRYDPTSLCLRTQLTIQVRLSPFILIKHGSVWSIYHCRLVTNEFIIFWVGLFYFLVEKLLSVSCRVLNAISNRLVVALSSLIRNT